MIKQPKILLLGIGSIGGIIASKLLQANFNCTLITSNDEITYTIAKNGLNVQDTSEKKPTIMYPKRVFTSVCSLQEQFDYIFFMMKTTKIKEAIDQTRHLLSPKGFVVTFQNGIVFDIFTKTFPNKVLTASVIFNSIMNSPGIYTVSKYEKIVIGNFTNRFSDKELHDLQEILSHVTTCEISENILGLC